MADRLNRVRASYLEVQRLLWKVEELENLATRTTPILSPTPKGNSGLPKDESWARLIDYMQECEAKISEYITNCIELEQELGCIRNQNIRTAMKYYYVDRKKQDEIAELMHYSDREIRYFLQKGRKIYKEVYDD